VRGLPGQLDARHQPVAGYLHKPASSNRRTAKFNHRVAKFNHRIAQCNHRTAQCNHRTDRTARVAYSGAIHSATPIDGDRTAHLRLADVLAPLMRRQARAMRRIPAVLRGYHLLG
jgi:hypothetical protein